MRRRQAKWVSGIGAVVLVGGLVLANYGAGVPAAGAQSATNPLTVVIQKLDQVLAALGGIQEGNHTLRWDTHNPSASRFVTAFAGAVLDKNTGLVWEQAPDATTRTWDGARRFCLHRNVGGTGGWRLPSVVELKSVQDPSLPAPFVPANVFTNVQSSDYWSATTLAETTLAEDRTAAWFVFFTNGDVNSLTKTFSKQVWCVRGGMNADQY